MKIKLYIYLVIREYTDPYIVAWDKPFANTEDRTLIKEITVDAGDFDVETEVKKLERSRVAKERQVLLDKLAEIEKYLPYADGKAYQQDKEKIKELNLQIREL